MYLKEKIMTPNKKTLEAWSRKDLVLAITTMLKFAGWALALIIMAYFLRFYVIPIFYTETSTQICDAKASWGQFGDFLGGTLNPILGLLTLLGVAYTVLLQQEAMLRVQADSTRSHEALNAQAELALLTARLQSLTSALEVISEQHSQALKASHKSAIDLLKKKESLAEQIIEINNRLNN
jgi:hypothetical protein